jgi:hypothetical protein
MISAKLFIPGCYPLPRLAATSLLTAALCGVTLAGMSDIINFRPNRMTDEEYARRRAELRERYGDSSREAGVRREQELARLFYVSGRTMEELARDEGKRPRWISYQVVFGRFVDFAVGSADPKSVFGQNTINEWRFRTLFAQTDTKGNERQRFLAVLDALGLPSAKPRDLVKEIAAHVLADGKFHPFADLVAALDADPDAVDAALKKAGKDKCKLETRLAGKSFKFRLFKQERPIAADEIAEKLGPIVQDMLTEGKKGPARISGYAVTILANRLQKLLAEWTSKAGQMRAPSTPNASREKSRKDDKK